jgi:transposase-like protein
MLPFFVTIAATVRRLKRRCPKCRRDHVFAGGPQGRTFVCPHCGTPMPPRRQSARASR